MINVRSDWSVAQVKEAIVRQSGLQPNQFKLVFAGMELKEQMTLQVKNEDVASLKPLLISSLLTWGPDIISMPTSGKKLKSEIPANAV